MSVRKSQIRNFLWYYDLRLAEPIYEPPSFVCWTSYHFSSRRFDIRQIQNLQTAKKNINDCGWLYQKVLNDLQRTRLSCGRMIRLLAHPLPPSRLPYLFLSLPVWRRSSIHNWRERWWGGEGVGEEPNHATTRKPGPQIIQYSVTISLSRGETTTV